MRDDAWADRNANILSLVAGGGAGKSAFDKVNEWLKRANIIIRCYSFSCIIGYLCLCAGDFFKKLTEMHFRFDDHTANRWGWRIDDTTSSKDKYIKVKGVLYDNGIFVNPDDFGAATSLNLTYLIYINTRVSASRWQLLIQIAPMATQSFRS
jgi:hypothetical protein